MIWGAWYQVSVAVFPFCLLVFLFSGILANVQQLTGSATENCGFFVLLSWPVFHGPSVIITATVGLFASYILKIFAVMSFKWPTTVFNSRRKVGDEKLCSNVSTALRSLVRPFWFLHLMPQFLCSLSLSYLQNRACTVPFSTVLCFNHPLPLCFSVPGQTDLFRLNPFLFLYKVLWIIPALWNTWLFHIMPVILSPSKSILCFPVLWKVVSVDHITQAPLPFGFYLVSASLEALADHQRKERDRGQDINFTFPHTPSCLSVAFGRSFIPLPKAMARVRQSCPTAAGLGKFPKLLLPFVPSGLEMVMGSSHCEPLRMLPLVSSPEAYLRHSKSSLHQTPSDLPFECAVSCQVPEWYM